MQNCIQIVQSAQLNVGITTAAQFFAWTRPFTLAVQFLRNWTYACAAGTECYLCTGKISHKILEWLNIAFYAQMITILLFGGLFYYLLVKWFPCQVISCAGDFDDLPVFFIVTDGPVNFAKVITVLTVAHLLPALLLVVIKMVTTHHVLALPASGRSLDARWSFVSTLIHSAVTVWGLAVALSVGEMASPWTLVWAWTIIAALADAVTVVLLVSSAMSEAALAHAKHAQPIHRERSNTDIRSVLYTYLCSSLCEHCLQIKRLFISKLFRQ
ncbi:unnamed protein product [Hydatigera taeniaeformis]|uniref:G_PROTEIN_RECEP_F1_2 domain-containing protein n=1 Tax=Hydatigena taeniaeformis TaxID=6205 RepID=A0A0R3WVV8_HYDTA|nr:unnamed protein product [Hydatigera taeniaeformis]